MLAELETLIGKENVWQNELMSQHTTFKIGGPADYFVTPKSKEDFKKVLSFAKERELPYLVIGEGSNLLVSDKGISGIVISTKKIVEFSVKENFITASCGVTLKDLANFAMENHLSGLEFSCGIPGNLGGAIYMNAGAYDGEMKDVVYKVEVMDEGGNIFWLDNEEMTFSYRHSLLVEKNLYCLSVIFSLKPSTKMSIQEKMTELTKKREEKQPLDLPSAGSTFKRPVGYFAGKLIIEAGMQGKRIGGAEVSKKHAGFIVNQGGATADDVIHLIEEIKEKVFLTSGVRLEAEVKLTGRK